MSVLWCVGLGEGGTGEGALISEGRYRALWLLILICAPEPGSLAMAMLNQSISAQCSERVNQVCAQACEAALSQ